MSSQIWLTETGHRMERREVDVLRCCNFDCLSGAVLAVSNPSVSIKLRAPSTPMVVFNIGDAVINVGWLINASAHSR
jgi:hypothetical protein